MQDETGANILRGASTFLFTPACQASHEALPDKSKGLNRKDKEIKSTKKSYHNFVCTVLTRLRSYFFVALVSSVIYFFLLALDFTTHKNGSRRNVPLLLQTCLS